MTRLLVLAFGDEQEAERTLRELGSLPAFCEGDILSCAVVRIAGDGELTITTTDRPGSGDPLWGMLWETLFGLVFLVPAAGSSYGANVGALFGALERAGIDYPTRERIRDALAPHTSGLSLLVHEDGSAVLADLERSHRGTAINATIALESDSELALELGAITA